MIIYFLEEWNFFISILHHDSASKILCEYFHVITPHDVNFSWVSFATDVIFARKYIATSWDFCECSQNKWKWIHMYYDTRTNNGWISLEYGNGNHRGDHRHRPDVDRASDLVIPRIVSPRRASCDIRGRWRRGRSSNHTQPRPPSRYPDAHRDPAFYDLRHPRVIRLLAVGMDSQKQPPLPRGRGAGADQTQCQELRLQLRARYFQTLHQRETR